MRIRRTWLIILVLLLTACARPRPTEPVVLAVSPDLTPPVLEGVKIVTTPAPLSELQAGKASLALVRDGRALEGYESFPFAVDEIVLFQAWLDPRLAFTRAEALERAARAPVMQPGQVPVPGALVRGSLSDLRPGWLAIPVDGVLPAPDTVWSGTYPLTRRVDLVYPRQTNGAVQTVADQLRAQAANRPVGWATLTVAGDFMLARGVARAMRENGTLYPVAKVAPHLKTADMTFANLESPIGVKGKPLPGKQIWFRAAPEAIDILKEAGVDGVALANNHILDYDTENFLETMERLDAAGIRYVGGGRNLAEARKPLILEAKGVKVAFLAYSQFADLFFDWAYPRSFAATDTLPGVPRIQDDWLAEEIKTARAQADIVAVAFHWGDEFQNYPNDEQKRLAHLSVDLGADLVLGYHPHSIQGFELYKNGFIAYSTGNFIMDRQDTDLARESMILDFHISRDGVRSVTVLPVWIKAEQPYIMTGAEGETLLQKMRTISGWK